MWAILFFVPLVFSTKFYLSFEVAKIVVFRGFLYLAVIFWVGKVLYEGRVSVPSIFRNGWFRVFLVLVPLVFVAGTLLSVAPKVSFWGSYFRQQGLFAYLHYFVFFVLLALGFSREQFKRALVVAGMALGIALVYGALQKFGIVIGNFNTDEFLGRVFSTFGHPNYFSSYILMLFFPLVAGVVVFFRRRRVGLGIFGSVLVGLSLVNFVLAGGRASVLGVGVGAVVGLVLLGVYLGRKRWVLAGIVVPLVLLTVVVGTLGRFDLKEENLRSIKTRLVMWPSVVEMISDSPWYGYGPDTFAIGYGPYMQEELLLLEDFNSIPDRAHNVVLQWMVDFGVVGAGILFAALVWFFGFVVRRMRELAVEDALLVIGGLSSLVGVFVANLFGFLVTVHLVVGSALLAFLVVMVSGKRVGLKFKLDGWLRMVIWAGVMAFSIMTLFPINFAERENTFVEDHAGLKHLFMGKIYAELSYEDAEYYELAEAEFEAAHELMPVYPLLYFERGKFYFLNGKEDEAEEMFNYYLSLSPPYWQYRVDGEDNGEDYENYRLFYKANPGFSEVFEYLGQD